jgi:hypothetical protein
MLRRKKKIIFLIFMMWLHGIFFINGPVTTYLCFSLSPSLSLSLSLSLSFPLSPSPSLSLSLPLSALAR